jgi:hypothetical protein
LTNSSNVNWNNIHAFNLVVNNNDIETIINNGIIMESVRILSLSKKINIEILKKLFPNCILINFSIYEFRLPKRKISDIINYYINANYIFINNDTDDCYANEYMYDLILSKNFNFTRSINLFSEDDRNKIYANIEDVFGTKTEMYKNANSA